MIGQPYASGTSCSNCASGTCCDSQGLCAGKLCFMRLRVQSIENLQGLDQKLFNDH